MPSKFESHHVLDVPIDAVTERDVLAFVRERVAAHEPAQIVTVNAEFVMLAQRNPEFLATLRNASLATPDSTLVVWAMRRRGAPVRRRVGGSDLIWTISEQAASLGHRVFLLGAKPGVAETAAKRLTATYPTLQVAGTYAGSPDQDEAGGIVNLIRRSKADIVFVAYGAPGQDIWIGRNLRATGAAVAIGVGGSIDYVAGTATRAPVWMRERGLEWLWRLIRQPWRWRRMLALPVFIWRVWWGNRQTGREAT